MRESTKGLSVVKKIKPLKASLYTDSLSSLYVHCTTHSLLTFCRSIQ